MVFHNNLLDEQNSLKEMSHYSVRAFILIHFPQFTVCGP